MLTTIYNLLKYPVLVYLFAGCVVWDWNFINWIPEMKITVGILIVISTLIGIDKNENK